MAAATLTRNVREPRHNVRESKRNVRELNVREPKRNVPELSIGDAGLSRTTSTSPARPNAIVSLLMALRPSCRPMPPSPGAPRRPRGSPLLRLHGVTDRGAEDWQV